MSWYGTDVVDVIFFVFRCLVVITKCHHLGSLITTSNLGTEKSRCLLTCLLARASGWLTLHLPSLLHGRKGVNPGICLLLLQIFILQCVIQADLELVSLLPRSPKCWDNRHVPPHMAFPSSFYAIWALSAKDPALITSFKYCHCFTGPAPFIVTTWRGGVVNCEFGAYG